MKHAHMGEAYIILLIAVVVVVLQDSQVHVLLNATTYRSMAND